MRRLRSFWRGVYDVRPGEGLRTLFMALHMVCVLFAYYILKPVSRALFLAKFDIDQLPYLYVLIAIVGGLLAYVYTRVAVRSSLAVAVNWATAIVVACLVALWWVLRFNFSWMLYVFNIWVSLFSIITVSQAWLVAANVFDSREARRLYGLLGLSAVVGAAFGGEFTARLARIIDVHNFLLATAGMVLLGYCCILVVAAQKNVNLKAAHAGEADEEFSFSDILDGIRRHRHLQVIIAIITITFVVDVMVDYQFSAMAKSSFNTKEDLTAFLGSFYGFYLNIATFSLQFFLTALIVRYFGVGGTLQIMPVVIGVASGIMTATPRLATASAMRLSEAAARYTFNRTGMELMYLPLPTALKNRTKAFVDIFMDRFGRGLGAMVLMGYLAVVETDPKHPNLIKISGLIFVICVFWVFLSARVSREYLATVRRRLESRRLDFADIRLTVTDKATIALLEKTLTEGTPRQSAYVLGLLADVPDYDIGPRIETLARSASAECRIKAFEVAAAAKYAGVAGLAAEALNDSRDLREHQATVAYLVALAPEDSPITNPWVQQAAGHPDAERRALAAFAIGLRGGSTVASGGPLRQLLEDRDPLVASTACRAAGRTGNRAYFDLIVQRLSDRSVRGVAVESLALYGARVCGTLGDLLNDTQLPAGTRRLIPRVLRLIHDQRSVDVLLAAANDETVRMPVIKALNRLRKSAPQLQFATILINPQIHSELRQCFLLHAQMAPLRATAKPRTPTALLLRSLETRLRQSRERAFRLIGLRYSQDAIHNAYLAAESGKPERTSAAHEYLDSALDRDTKRALLPLLDSPDRLAVHARDLFHIEPKTPEAALRELLASGDSWITLCAMASAAELHLKGLAADIASAGERAGKDSGEVARAAAAALA